MKRSDSSYSKIIRTGKNYNASFISTTIRKFLFSFSIISILLTSVSAQTNFKSGYVVKVGNDTLKGYLDDRGDIRNAKLIVYKAELNANPVTYYPNDLLGFEIGNNFYISHKIKTEQTELIVFLNVIETGRISLYMYRDKLSADHFYVKKDSSFQALTNEIIKYYSDGAAFQKNQKNIIRF